jgi:hypothetical protein
MPVVVVATLAALLPATSASAYASPAQDDHARSAVSAPPQAPLNVVIHGEDQGLHLVWDRPPGDPPVMKYRLGFTPAIRGASFWDLDLGEPHVDVHVGGIPGGRSYTFTVQSLTGEDTSAPITKNFSGSYFTVSIPTSVVHGATVAITGRLLDPISHNGLAQRTVRLYRKQLGGHGWRWISSDRTVSPSGGFAFHPIGYRNAIYRVRFPSESLYLLGNNTGKHAVAVRQKVTLKASDTTVSQDATVFFTGRVTPTRSGVVKLERRHGGTGHWTVVARDALDSTGRYALAWTPHTRKNFQWRVVVKKTDRLARGVSRVRTVRVT